MPIVAVAVCACATAPKIELESQHAVKTVAMVRIAEPPAQPVLNLGGVAGAFGLIGGLAQNSLNEAHTKAYSELVRQRNPAFASSFEADIAAQLRAAGFDVSASDARPLMQSDGRNADYSSIDVPQDAILHAWFTILGYVSPPSKIAFQPWVTVRVRMVDARKKNDLYFKTFTCGYESLTEGVVRVRSDPRFEYDSFDALTDRVDESIAGLTACNRAIAVQVASDFARR